jgi:hypothetical protein
MHKKKLNKGKKSLGLQTLFQKSTFKRAEEEKKFSIDRLSAP